MIFYGQKQAISRYDKNALSILQGRLERLEKIQTTLKKINNLYLSNITIEEKKSQINELISDDLIVFLDHYRINLNFKEKPFKHKILQTNMQRIYNLRKRIEIITNQNQEKKSILLSNDHFKIIFLNNKNYVLITFERNITSHLKKFLRQKEFKWNHYYKSWVIKASPDIVKNVTKKMFVEKILSFLD